MTPADRLQKMQEDVAALYSALVEYDEPGSRELRIALIDVMSDLDIAVDRARRV